MTPSVAQKLAQAVHHWLTFQSLCDREEIFSESYLSQPVAEFLAARYRGHLVSEYLHPGFRSTGGRPRQIDFALLRKSRRDLESAIECKWIASREPSKQAIIDDLMRLELILTGDIDINRYFLLAGRSVHLNTHFWPLSCRMDGESIPFSQSLFHRSDATPKSVAVLDATPALARYFRAFSTEFHVQIPTRFRTELVAGIEGNEVSVFLWRIRSPGNRKTFQPGSPAATDA